LYPRALAWCTVVAWGLCRHHTLEKKKEEEEKANTTAIIVNVVELKV
jgi:hypothetical protein